MAAASTDRAGAPRDIVAGLFDARLRPSSFERVADTRWVRDRHAPIRHLVELYAAKGGGWFPRWGLSLDFVPHVERGAVRRRATTRAARIDLGYDPLDHVDPAGAHAWRLDGGGSGARIADRAVAEACAWLDPVVDLDALLAAFAREQARRAIRFGFDDYDQHRLALAFTLARAGDDARARAELDRWMTERAPDPQVASALREQLEEAARS